MTADASREPTMSACAEHRDELALHADGELAEPERGQLERHLEACAPCRRVVEQARAVRRTVRERSFTAAPAHLRARIGRALDAEPAPAHEPAPPPTAPQPPRAHWSRRLLRPAPVAAAGATALGLAAWMYAPPQRDDFARDAVAKHSRRLPLEVESSDPQMLESWLADKVAFRVRLPRVARADLRPVGARLADVRDRSAAYVVYGNRQSPTHRVSLLVFDDPLHAAPAIGLPHRVEDHEVFTTSAAGFNVAAFKQDELIYTVVGDHDEDIAEIVRAAYHPEP
jgi:anti-sigma factor (TIGR02949 family)